MKKLFKFEISNLGPGHPVKELHTLLSQNVPTVQQYNTFQFACNSYDKMSQMEANPLLKMQFLEMKVTFFIDTTRKLLKIIFQMLQQS